MLEKYESDWEDATNDLEELDGVWIETEKELYPTTTNGIIVIWNNTIGDSIAGGFHFTLEKEVSGKWKKVTKESDFVKYPFTSFSFSTSQDKFKYIYKLNNFWYGDELTEGNYRISTTFSRETKDGETLVPSPEYQVYAYFKVREFVNE